MQAPWPVGPPVHGVQTTLSSARPARPDLSHSLPAELLGAGAVQGGHSKGLCEMERQKSLFRRCLPLPCPWT